MVGMLRVSEETEGNSCVLSPGEFKAGLNRKQELHQDKSGSAQTLGCPTVAHWTPGLWEHCHCSPAACSQQVSLVKSRKSPTDNSTSWNKLASFKPLVQV